MKPTESFTQIHPTWFSLRPWCTHVVQSQREALASLSSDNFVIAWSQLWEQKGSLVGRAHKPFHSETSYRNCICWINSIWRRLISFKLGFNFLSSLPSFSLEKMFWFLIPKISKEKVSSVKFSMFLVLEGNLHFLWKFTTFLTNICLGVIKHGFHSLIHPRKQSEKRRH